MCLYVDAKRHPGNRPRVAAYDILCFKRMDKQDYHGKDVYESPYRSFRWTAGKLVTATFERAVLFSVHTGLHACLTLKDAKGRSEVGNRTLPCVIPKGTKFYIGKNGDIVAEAMIAYPNIRAAMKGRELRKPRFQMHQSVPMVG